MSSKGEATILNLIAFVIGIIFILWGIGDLGNSSKIGSFLGPNIQLDLSAYFIGPVKIFVGIILIILALSPGSIRMNIFSRYP